MSIHILFEDDTLLVINKPAGIVVNRAQSVKEKTVQDWVEETYHVYIENRAGIVHRIDKETSGCLLIAKTIDSFVHLQRQFKERTITKVYRAIAHGKFVPNEGEICAPIGRLPWNRERFGVVPGGKEAKTRYKVIKTNGTYSVVDLYPQSGRTHQIRVHLKYIHHPVVGDYLYAGRKTSREDRIHVKRVMLHAWKISFVHPTTHAHVDVEAPIPDDMSNVV